MFLPLFLLCAIESTPAPLLSLQKIRAKEAVDAILGPATYPINPNQPSNHGDIGESVGERQHNEATQVPASAQDDGFTSWEQHEPIVQAEYNEVIECNQYPDELAPPASNQPADAILTAVSNDHLMDAETVSINSFQPQVDDAEFIDYTADYHAVTPQNKEILAAETLYSDSALQQAAFHAESQDTTYYQENIQPPVDSSTPLATQPLLVDNKTAGDEIHDDEKVESPVVEVQNVATQPQINSQLMPPTQVQLPPESTCTQEEPIIMDLEIPLPPPIVEVVEEPEAIAQQADAYSLTQFYTEEAVIVNEVEYQQQNVSLAEDIFAAEIQTDETQYPNEVLTEPFAAAMAVSTDTFSTNIEDKLVNESIELDDNPPEVNPLIPETTAAADNQVLVQLQPPLQPEPEELTPELLAKQIQASLDKTVQLDKPVVLPIENEAKKTQETGSSPWRGQDIRYYTGQWPLPLNNNDNQ